MTKKITPDCRYGHGDLQLCINPVSSPGDWFASFNSLATGQVHLGATFIYRIYKCAKCTYLEMHDVPTEEFEAAKHAALVAMHAQQVAAAKHALEAAQKVSATDVQDANNAN